MSSTLPIPVVPKKFYGLMGNLPNIDPAFLNESIWKLTELYGPIYELDMVSRGKMVVLSTYELLKDVLKDEKYEKCVIGALDEVRLISKDGLFTAYPHEENWFKAHRILMPVFGPMAVRKMFDDMVDIAGQLVMKWDRTGPRQEIDIVDDFTRLAFDTIGLCAFSYRFNNFYSVDTHPFVTQMGDALHETGARAVRTNLETSLRYFSQKKLENDIGAMHKLCDELVEERYDHPQPDNQDLLNTMLNVTDPETGERLTKENIRFQLVTFLIAGHETTSGTLSFLFYLLLKHPEKYHKAQQQIDDVVGDQALTINHLAKLKYIDACIKETLRVQGPINLLGRQAKKPEIIAGKYPITPDHSILVDLHFMHRDSAVWGADAKEFRPERWFEPDVPIHAWKPFGTGVRACIGRAFTEQEMLLTTALILQRFQITVDPAYELQVKSTLTVKPHGFYIKAQRRPGKSLLVGLGALSNQTKSKFKDIATVNNTNQSTAKVLTILYGSNAGTCKTYADELASDSERYGFSTTVKTLDSIVEQLPTDHPVVIIVPSYEGLPADNAKKFCSWLESNSKNDSPDKLKNVNYLLFGVGNSEWRATYHKVPKTLHYLMEKMGAHALVEPGFVDVKTDAVGPWEDWCETVWPALVGKDPASTGAVIKASIQHADSSAVLGGFVATEVTVKENIPLTEGKTGPLKMHMEVELPENMKYTSGDYLVVIPWNHLENVRRVIIRFGVRADDMIHVTESRKNFLKTPYPISIFDLLTSRVELSTPITRRQLEKIAGLVPSELEKERLWQNSIDFEKNFLLKRVSALDVLEDYPSCKLGFIEYLDLLQQLSPRQYSISSSPLVYTNAKRMTATITYDVLVAPALSGNKRTHYGPCSTMLARAKPGSHLTATVRSTNTGFHLPSDPKVPVIMIAAGTGVAPMRGFIQERAAIKKARGDQALGPALLYFGCRNKEDDFIYRQELEEWEASGIVSLRMCFSREKEDSGSNTFKYTNDRIYAEREEIAELFKNGAKVFVCGSASKIGKSTADVCLKIWRERNPDKSEEEALEWAQSIKEDRYVSDVFG